MSSLITRGLTPQEWHSFQWIKAPFLIRICEVLAQAHSAYDVHNVARLVGGCVRDGLVGKPSADIDMATPIPPEQIMQSLEGAGMRCMPTGIDHGTVTVITEQQSVEITTLRRDVSTDGRRATIAYTDDWTEDAHRRDFTINALYLSIDGVFYDPVGGLADLAEGCVRFIGDANARIREDFLRILRFFRFSARFAQKFDETGLDAIQANLDGIGQLSNERVGGEFLKILALARASDAISAMVETGTLSQIWQRPYAQEQFERFKMLQPEGRPIAALAVLFDDHQDGLAERLRLSRQQKELLARLPEVKSLLAAVRTQKQAEIALYHLGADIWEDAVWYTIAYDPGLKNILQPFLTLPTKWQPPTLPVSGKDIVAMGYSPGPVIAAILKDTEHAWIEAGFPKREETFELLKECAQKNNPA